MRAYKGVVFDLDYTLYDEHEYFFSVIDAFCRVSDCEDKSDGMKNSFFRARKVGIDIIECVLERAAAPVNEELKKTFFELYVSHDCVLKPYSDALGVLQRLGELGLALAVLTNGLPRVQMNKLRCLGVSPFFDQIVCAREYGREFEKPHYRCFERACSRLRIAPVDLAFVGDNPNIDFVGAKRIGAGLTFRLRRGPFEDLLSNSAIDITSDSLEALIPLLL